MKTKIRNIVINWTAVLNQFVEGFTWMCGVLAALGGLMLLARLIGP